METLRWIGFGAFFVPSLVIGIRLLLLARRTGQIPELLIGIAVLGVGPLGYGFSILAFATARRAAILSATLWGSGFLAVFIDVGQSVGGPVLLFRRIPLDVEAFLDGGAFIGIVPEQRAGPGLDGELALKF